VESVDIVENPYQASGQNYRCSRSHHFLYPNTGMFAPTYPGDKIFKNIDRIVKFHLQYQENKLSTTGGNPFGGLPVRHQAGQIRFFKI
jgi:hypothetical protein